ncbi:MAG: STAS domain-containing protein [Leptospira sp.]|jgi:anti-anti-sigma factor|nr:STAS domain-containing protein [Leptospira sp.]
MSNLEFSSLKLKIETRTVGKDQVVLLIFDGQITNTNAYEINEKVNEIFQNNIYNLILDLTYLQYINSIGVSTLLSMIKIVEQHQGRMYIGGLNPFLDNVLKLMDIPKQIKIFPTSDLAIANWK